MEHVLGCACSEFWPMLTCSFANHLKGTSNPLGSIDVFCPLFSFLPAGHQVALNPWPYPHVFTFFLQIKMTPPLVNKHNYGTSQFLSILNVKVHYFYGHFLCRFFYVYQRVPWNPFGIPVFLLDKCWISPNLCSGGAFVTSSTCHPKECQNGMVRVTNFWPLTLGHGNIYDIICIIIYIYIWI